MTEKHLIAMMLYCNYDKMQRKLSETYTKSDEKESDTSLKERHSNYYFWGRSLRECVECFGTDFSPEVDSADITLFRGINQQFMFESTLANIKGPFSTTTEYAVALNFCANKGMVLEMILQPQSWIFKWLEGMEAATRLSCIDCRFISDFSSENEIFCIGGLNPFRLSTIIEPSGVNYVQYINALNHLTVGMSTRFNFGQIAFDCMGGKHADPYLLPSSQREWQMIFRLVSHELHRYKPAHPKAYEFKGCPEYMKKILHLHCENITTINFPEHLNKLYDVFFKEKNGWIHVDILTTIFPNVVTIGFFAFSKDISFITESLLVESVLHYVSSQKQTSLRSITVMINPKHAEKVSNYIKQYQSKFNDYSWTISIAEQLNACIPNYKHMMKTFVDALPISSTELQHIYNTGPFQRLRELAPCNPFDDDPKFCPLLFAKLL
eukprot:429594_1